MQSGNRVTALMMPGPRMAALGGTTPDTEVDRKKAIVSVIRLGAEAGSAAP